MIIDILTGFPEIFSGLVNSSILRAALLNNALEIWVHDLRHYTSDKHGNIDDVPYGGGPGMVLMAQPVWQAIDELSEYRAQTPFLVFLTPQGKQLTQQTVREFVNKEWLLILCGHYKDVDARVFERDAWNEISIGDYVLRGGENAAAVLVDSIGRLLPGVLSDSQSAETDSFEDGLLDAPYYTRPEDLMGLRVPDILISGHHARIEKWRLQQRLERTRARRPDLHIVHQEKNRPTE